MISLTGSQARALFEHSEGADHLTLRAGGVRKPYLVVVETRDANSQLLESLTLDRDGRVWEAQTDVV